jgi:hypothetical protein
MYRPATPQQPSYPSSGYGQAQAPSVRSILYSDKNYRTLQTVLVQDFEERLGGPLTEPQTDRLSKSLQHYINQVYEKQGDKPIQILNKEVLGTCAKDFSQYLQRKELTKNTNTVKTVMDESLFQETSQRFERLTQERNDIKTLPSSIPDFRISLSEDGPPAAEMFERAKKQREMEALRSASQANDMAKADAGIQGRIHADSSFRTLQDSQNRSTELALVQRNSQPVRPIMDQTLVVLPDRRELLSGSIGLFDTMIIPEPRGQANSNMTIVQPQLYSLEKPLPQNNIIREDKVVSYREIENNLFIYSADRDWLRNNKENRYSFTVNFDPAANGQGFGPSLASQQKFKNIVRIELVKAIVPGESLSVTVSRNSTAPATDTTYQDNILNLPYISLRVAELENNNYGTDNFLDRSFGVLQYDAQWMSDHSHQQTTTRGYLAMIPKFLKCQKEYYPTPLSTLQKMTIDMRRPNGELISNSSDTFDIMGIIAPQVGTIVSYTFPFTIPLTVGSGGGVYNMLIPPITGDPANFYINTSKYFSKFEISPGDRIQISGYTYTPDVFAHDSHGSSMSDFCNWVNRPEGHLVLAAAYSPTNSTLTDGYNEVGYANFIVIQARYQDPSTGSTLLSPFGANFGATLRAFGVNVQTPMRLMNLNKQVQLVFRIITREMDSLPQLRPDNNY